MNGNTVPVGFRFHPTDEELVGCYLLAKVRRTQAEQFIREIDLYKIEPWDLHDLCRIGDDARDTQTDLYFFSHKDKKYPTGNRANRATVAGFWKATGRDKPIHERRQLIGKRKTLVFYQGRAPNGQKTNWIMHEFRLDEGLGVIPNYEADGWVVCRVFQKTKNIKMFKSEERASCSFDDEKVEPELSSPEKFSRDCGDGSDGYTSFSNNDYFTCTQDLSVDDYSTPTDEPFIDAFPQVEMHRFGDVSLAPSSSCTFRSIPYTTSRRYGYSVPFPLPTTFNEFDNVRSSATQDLFYPPLHSDDSWIRRDQSLSDVGYQSSEHFSSSQEMLTTWY